MFKKSLLITLLFFIVACESMPKSWRWGIKPRPLTGIRNFPSIESEYGKGFKDGCGAGFDAVSKGLTSDFHGKRFDYKRLQKSPDYNLGWFDGIEQCTYIIDHDVV